MEKPNLISLFSCLFPDYDSRPLRIDSGMFFGALGAPGSQFWPFSHNIISVNWHTLLSSHIFNINKLAHCLKFPRIRRFETQSLARFWLWEGRNRWNSLWVDKIQWLLCSRHSKWTIYWLLICWFQKFLLSSRPSYYLPWFWSTEFFLK